MNIIFLCMVLSINMCILNIISTTDILILFDCHRSLVICFLPAAHSVKGLRMVEFIILVFAQRVCSHGPTT